MIIYEDKNVLAINKTPGVIVENLIQEILKKYPQAELAHRLDKDTSGVLIIAKNHNVYEPLKEQFKNREVKKTYIALAKGVVKNKTGIIDSPIKRFTKSRDAVTKYKVIQTFRLSDSRKYSLLEVYPKTGRTHQIRAHLKSIGHPIVCDKLYTKKPDCPFGLKRHFLHAYSLELTLPDGGRIKLEADLPEDLQTVLKKLKKYDKQNP